MPSGPANLRLVLGLKVRARREALGWTLQQLGRRAGFAVSYLSEIEKGKKYPKPEKLLALAEALETPFEELVSPRVAEELTPLSSFARSEFLRQFPFELFGLRAADLFDLVATEPRRAGALLRALGEMARRYDLEVEHLLFAALRSYQQMHGNHFPEIEAAAERFRSERGWGGLERLEEPEVRHALEERFGTRVDFEALARIRELSDLRSVFADGRTPTLFLNPRLLSPQRAFAAAREIGYRVLGLKERPVSGSWLRAESFEQVLNNFRASYFAGALLLPADPLVEAFRGLLGGSRLPHGALSGLLTRFGGTPEMLFYRISQLAPARLGLEELFFVRFFRDDERRWPRLTKVLNLARVDVPYGVAPEEHSCARWPGVALLVDPYSSAADGAPSEAAAVCRFQSEPLEFLVLSLARPLALRPKTLSSVSLGFLIGDELRRTARCLADPALARLEVDLTCERCPLPSGSCAERVAPPRVLDRGRRLEARQEALDRLLERGRGAALR